MTLPFDPTARLVERRAEVRERIDGLHRDVAEIVAASSASNADDEHDPEGATIAFEREQISALLAAARTQLSEIDDAITRIETGAYGRCVRCGQVISAPRLAARPSAARCITCAKGI